MGVSPVLLDSLIKVCGMAPLTNARGEAPCAPLSIVWKRTPRIGEPKRLLLGYISALYANRASDDAPCVR